jgi:hypothetical protein
MQPFTGIVTAFTGPPGPYSTPTVPPRPSVGAAAYASCTRPFHCPPAPRQYDTAESTVAPA